MICSVSGNVCYYYCNPSLLLSQCLLFKGVAMSLLLIIKNIMPRKQLWPKLWPGHDGASGYLKGVLRMRKTPVGRGRGEVLCRFQVEGSSGLKKWRTDPEINKQVAACDARLVWEIVEFGSMRRSTTMTK